MNKIKNSTQAGFENRQAYRKSLCRNPQNDKKIHNLERGLRQRL